ncbi:MAG TPA: MarC family protein [Gammaproteobacteria bacterium]|nr:MarC family protein [Gammaproteobacteria bacterium]
MLSNTVLLFLVIDPFGLIPIYLSLMRRVPPERRTRVLLRELTIALAALVLFLFAGKYLLALLRISESSLAVSGGLILFLIALPMIFPAIKLGFTAEGSSEPFIVPLATPLFAGPSALTLVMLIGNDRDGAWPAWLAAVFAAWLAAAVVLLLGNAIAKLIGERGLVALERLMGMFLVAMAVEMLLSGLAAYFRALPS